LFNKFPDIESEFDDGVKNMVTSFNGLLKNNGGYSDVFRCAKGLIFM
jgi:hypothetical protein